MFNNWSSSVTPIDV
uniref:Uncharacterized protein n=1 Tax=Arundo donax TaxID=35708 RepID=A0A0A9FHS1_ARUDO